MGHRQERKMQALYPDLFLHRAEAAFSICGM
jgi:hypothetical protein